MQSLCPSIRLWVRGGICCFSLVTVCLASVSIVCSFGFIMVINFHPCSFNGPHGALNEFDVYRKKCMGSRSFDGVLAEGAVENI